jgi:hypothetical protein
MGASHPDGKCARQISANGTAFAGLGCLGRATQHEIALPMDHERVNQAIRDCLQHCYQASQVLPVIAGFMAGMKAAGGWDDDEIRVVEIGVHKILGGIVAAPIYPGDATNVSSGDVGRGGSETTKLSGA